MDCNLYFVIPIRHHATIRDWGVVQRNLIQTLASIAAQTVPNWECRLVASHGSVLPPLPPRCVARFIDLPAPALPDPRQGRQAYFDAIRHDKGLRIHAGVHDLPPEAFFMPVDYDDFVSRELAGFVARNAQASGWYIPQGYHYDGGRLLWLTNRLHLTCGTSHILRRGIFGSFQAPDGTPDMPAIKQQLGSHLFNLPDLAGTANALAPLPFPGAVYRVGNPQSAIGQDKSLFRQVTPPRKMLRHPLETLRRLARYRPLTAKIRQEFSLP